MDEQYTEFLERQAKKDQETIAMLTATLEDIAAWAEEHGAHWCRVRARDVLNKKVKL